MFSIKEISGNVIEDSRKGEKTIAATLVLASGVRGTASVPSGKSKGIHEAATVEPERSLVLICDGLSDELVGKEFASQNDFDQALIKFDGTLDKSFIGGNTTLALSLAFARACAAENNQFLFQYFSDLLGDTPRGKLRLYANLIEGGLHAKNNLRFQEHLAIPAAAPFSRQIEILKSLFNALGGELAKRYGEPSVKIGDEGGYDLNFGKEDEPFAFMKQARDKLGIIGMDFGMDAAGSDVKGTPEELFNIYVDWQKRFGLIYIEDPFNEEDFENTKKLDKTLPKEVIVCGDDLTTTNVELMKKAREADCIDGVIVKPNQIGTVSEAINAVALAREYGWFVVVSHRSGETLDDWVADFAVGAGADGFKLGAPNRPERLAKYDRLLRIEEEIASIGKKA